MSDTDATAPGSRAPRFTDDLLFQAARLYYENDATQAQIAAALGTSRPTVSRLLTEARARGIVHIEVRDPTADDASGLAADLADTLGLERCWVTPNGRGMPAGTLLAPAVGEALRDADLRRGDSLVVSSGATAYDVSNRPLPSLPGVLVAPTVGGQDEPEAYYQTNEIARRLAATCDAQPLFLYAPALPGPDLYDSLLSERSVAQVVRAWSRARCALLGIGGPPAQRTSVPSVFPTSRTFLRRAVGDICARPYDADGAPVEFPGSDRIVAMRLEALRHVPSTVGMAVGAAKVSSILVAAQAGYINRLVTDRDTARALLDAVGSAPAGTTP